RPCVLIARARPSRRSVSPAMAETTTTSAWPASRAASTLSATPSMRSTPPTEVPPNFWTISATRASVSGAELASDPVFDRGQRAVQLRGIGAAGHRHVGAAAALAANLCGDEIHQVAGLELRGFRLGDASGEL